ncbi:MULTISPECIES: PBECR4 domain-containing protein [Levilactobacillus]|uniref:PBECR4 domain-containing protein n=1 Tax=Levilactobacillus TaxID=2767886 RepID=UPI00194F0BEC|nr:PBECR4 domain-containing protein [Levilactobacillus sp. 244-2]
MTRDVTSIPLNHLLISSGTDIDFKMILEDYRACFSGHKVHLTTNYNQLSQFDIVFSENQLPHLMGWEKVKGRGSKSASAIITEVDSGTWTLSDAKKNQRWHEAKKRMLNYNIMHRIFLDQDLVPMVLTSDMKPNRLKLDIVFVANKAHESVILGFRKSKDKDFFVPTTLHTESLNNSYNLRRRTKISSLEWVD